MAKPIFVIRVERRLWKDDRISKMFDDMQKKLPEYHVLMMPSESETRTDFECFNVNDYESKSIEELQKWIYSEIGANATDESEKTKKETVKPNDSE